MTPPAPSTGPEAPTPPGDSREDVSEFGRLRLPAHEKTRRVRTLFDGVARRYDLMNDLMSGGLHRLWKRAMLDWLAPRPGMGLVDVAGGTGDIAFRFLDRRQGGDTPVILVDQSPGMLAVGRERAAERGHGDRIVWLCGAAEALPLADRRRDAYTIAFGLRNVTDRRRALGEAYRVLKPGGRFLCLEFSHVVLPLLEGVYDLYGDTVIPALGQWVAGDRPAYDYLVDSIRGFPAQEALAAEIAGAGFARLRIRNLAGGIAALHSAWRL